MKLKWFAVSALAFSLGASTGLTTARASAQEGPPPPGYGQGGWDAPPQEFRDVQRQGFHDGIEGARKDFDNHRQPDVKNRDEFRHPRVERSMRAVQREVGEFVVELSATQLNDVSLASLVLRMARAALADAGIGHKAVIALVQPHIGSDILVAIQAQRGLRSRIGTVVAVGAVLLLLDMCLRQFAGHQQRFYAGGARRARWACE